MSQMDQLRAAVEELRYRALDPRHREQPPTPSIFGAREGWAYSHVLELIDALIAELPDET